MISTPSIPAVNLPDFMNPILNFLQGFIPPTLGAGRRERLYGCIGAGLGLQVTALLSHLFLGQVNPWFIAPMGASAVLLFAVPSSPLAQPWSIIGGNMLSAAIGVSCARYIGDPALAASLAGALAIAAMFQLRCLHPPGGAVAITAVLGGPAIHTLGYQFVLWPVAVNSALMLGMALLFNNALRRGYPHRPQPAPNAHHTADPLPSQRRAISQQDLHQALAAHGEVLDISEEDLLAILTAAEEQAQQRRLGGIHCADIMSRDVVSIAPDASLQEAWDKLAHHKIKALPVVSPAQALTGIVSLHDFFLPRDGQAAHLPGSAGWDRGTVADIMTSPVRHVAALQPITALSQAFSDGGLHHMPVVDADGKLCGIITQSDLIAILLKN